MPINTTSINDLALTRQVVDLCPNQKRHYSRRAQRSCAKLRPHELGVLDSLKIYGNEHLYGTTLLDKEIHTQQAKSLFRRAVKLFDLDNPTSFGDKPYGLISKYGHFESPRNNELRKTLRAITIIDSVTETKEAALRKCLELKSLLKCTLKTLKGIRLIGSIEVEVYPLNLASIFRQHILDSNLESQDFSNLRSEDDKSITKSQFRKLDNCLNLAKCSSIDLEKVKSSLFLVHFHGLINASTIDELNEVELILKQTKQWSIAPRQVLLKTFRTPSLNNQRLLIDEVKEWCKYSTKMGKRQSGKYSYHRYNIDVPDGFMDSPMSLNLAEKFMLLTQFEVSEMYALTSDLMNVSKQKNGHIVAINTRESCRNRNS